MFILYTDLNIEIRKEVRQTAQNWENKNNKLLKEFYAHDRIRNKSLIPKLIINTSAIASLSIINIT